MWQNPLALEAIGPLVDLGVEAREILAIVERSEAFQQARVNYQQQNTAQGLDEKNELALALGVWGGSAGQPQQQEQQRASLSVAGSWLENYVEGLVGQRRNDHSMALQHWGALDNRFPNNLPSLLNLGLVHFNADRLDDAHYYFNKAR